MKTPSNPMADANDTTRPRVVVLSHLYPHAGNPGAGLFVRERMLRVARHLPLVVVTPVPWFPGQGLIRRFRPHFRPPAPRFEQPDGVAVFFPRYVSVPGLAKSLDGWLMALGCRRLLRRLRAAGRVDVIDAHFGYPDGFAAGRLGRWLGVPVTITLRGTEPRLAARPVGRRLLRSALARATRVFTVADALRRLALTLGADPAKVRVVANGVDTAKFRPIDQAAARRELGVPADSPVLISVGTLVERKGFHRVMAVLPRLRQAYPGLRYLVVGGAGPEGDGEAWLRQQAEHYGVADMVQFLGPVAPEALRVPLSAADVFVLATRNEGWANVFLEAMACGLPVVTTDVGGNREVVARPELGEVVPFGEATALGEALERALAEQWDHAGIRAYAEGHAWEGRVATLVAEFRRIAGPSQAGLADPRARLGGEGEASR